MISSKSLSESMGLNLGVVVDGDVMVLAAGEPALAPHPPSMAVDAGSRPNC